MYTSIVNPQAIRVDWPRLRYSTQCPQLVSSGCCTQWYLFLANSPLGVWRRLPYYERITNQLTVCLLIAVVCPFLFAQWSPSVDYFIHDWPISFSFGWTLPLPITTWSSLVSVYLYSSSQVTLRYKGIQEVPARLRLSWSICANTSFDQWALLHRADMHTDICHFKV